MRIVISPSYIPEDRALEWCRVIRDERRPYFSGGIFPRELAVFLAACDVCDVDFIAESGRQDGYSTAILADYAERTGTRVVSMDRPLVDDPERGAAARTRLAGRPVTLLDGVTELLLGGAVPADAERVALLVDGPKGRDANRLILAAATTLPLVLAGCHGVIPDAPEARELRRWFPDLTVAELEGDEFESFREWERELIRPHAPDMPDRQLDQSEFAIARVRPIERRRRRLFLHDRGRGALEAATFTVGHLRRKPAGMVPAAFLAKWIGRSKRAARG
jgi:hypothetical protein